MFGVGRHVQVKITSDILSSQALCLYNFSQIVYLHSHTCFYSLLNNKMLDQSKLKAFADNKIRVTGKKIEIYLGKGRKHCGKRRKCCLPAFSPFPTMFSKGFFYRVVKSCGCVVKSSLITRHLHMASQCCTKDLCLWNFRK